VTKLPEQQLVCLMLAVFSAAGQASRSCCCCHFAHARRALAWPSSAYNSQRAQAGRSTLRTRVCSCDVGGKSRVVYLAEQSERWSRVVQTKAACAWSMRMQSGRKRLQLASDPPSESGQMIEPVGSSAAYIQYHIPDFVRSSDRQEVLGWHHAAGRRVK
jgi:hypothetical protein